MRGIQSCAEGNQTLPTNGNHAGLTLQWLRLPLAHSYHNTLTLRVGCEMNEWGEEDSEEGGEMDRGE